MIDNLPPCNPLSFKTLKYNLLMRYLKLFLKDEKKIGIHYSIDLSKIFMFLKLQASEDIVRIHIVCKTFYIKGQPQFSLATPHKQRVAWVKKILNTGICACTQAGFFRENVQRHIYHGDLKVMLRLSTYIHQKEA